MSFVRKSTALDGSAIRGLASDGSRIIGVGHGSKFIYSDDGGVTWGSYNSPFGSTSATSIAYAEGLWVASGYSGLMATSTDGVNWTSRTSQFGTTYIWNVHHFVGFGWVAVGGSGKISTSADGLTWTARTSNVTVTLYSCALYDGKIVACGTGVVVSTTNLSSWTAETLPLSVIAYKIVATDGGLRIYGDGICAIGTVGAFSIADTMCPSLQDIVPVGDVFMTVVRGAVYIGSQSLLTWHMYQTLPDYVGYSYALLELNGTYLIGSENGVYVGSLGTPITVSGVITGGDGAAAQRTVHVFCRENGTLLSETQSDPVTGEYVATIYPPESCTEMLRIAHADDAAEGVVYNDIIDRLLVR